jgi:hypothetical protein
MVFPKKAHAKKISKKAIQRRLVPGNHKKNPFPHGKPHPGFKSIQDQIAQGENISMKAAGAILAKSSRKASPATKKKNPFLKKV